MVKPFSTCQALLLKGAMAHDTIVPIKLNQIAILQMQVLEDNHNRNLLK